jgi:hypothetical protein
VIRILVNDYLVAVPQPVIDEIEFEWRNREPEISDSESVPAASPDPEDVAGAKPARKPPVLKWMIEMEPSVISAHIMADPRSVSVNVRSVWMALTVYESPVWGLNSGSTPGRRRPVLGNESSTNPLLSSLMLGLLLLGNRRH